MASMKAMQLALKIALNVKQRRKAISLIDVLE
jgi:hypothetical protein